MIVELNGSVTTIDLVTNGGFEKRMYKFCTGFSVDARLSPWGILDNLRRHSWLLTSGEVVLASHGGGQTCCKTSCNAQNSLQQRCIQPQNVSGAEMEKPWSRQTLQ